MNKTELSIRINPLMIITIMTLIVIILALMHIFQLVIYFEINDSEVFDFIKMVDFDYEGNLPSLYSSLSIIFCGLMLLVIAIKKRQLREVGQYHWLCLGIIFLLLGIDEGVAIHEEIGDLTENFVDNSGFFYFAWVIPYGIALVLFCLSYLKFLIILPRKTAIQFVIAGALFITGAIGIEIFSAREADINGTETILYSTLYTIEELCEMFGIIIFAYALMRYIGEYLGPFRIEFVVKQPNDQSSES